MPPLPRLPLGAANGTASAFTTASPFEPPAMGLATLSAPAAVPTGAAPGESIGTIEDGRSKKSLGKQAGGIGGVLLLLLAKAKTLLAALKFGKLATTFASMFVSILFYAALYSWKFAIGFVLLIFVHEMGHVLALKRRRIPVEGMFFIPFLGAAVAFKKRPADPAVDAEISAAGPFAGWLGGLVCAGVYAATGQAFWLALAHVSFLLNLINLAPAVPLDGGWIVRAINPKFSLVGALIGALVGLFLHSTILVIVAVLGALNFARTSKFGDDDIYKKDAPPAAKTRVTLAYLGLLLALGVSLGYSTHALHADRARRGDPHALANPLSPVQPQTQPQ